MSVAEADADPYWSTACKLRAGTRFARALQMHGVVRTRFLGNIARPGASPPTSAPRSMLEGRRSIVGGVLAKSYRSSGLQSRRSSLVHAVRKIAPISMRAAFVTADRRLDSTPNPRLSLPVRLRSNRRNRVGLVGEGLPRLLPLRGETIGQATEIVAIVQFFQSGVAGGPNVATLSLELLSLRCRYQPEIVLGMLEIVLRGDRVAGCVSVARQLEVSFCHVQRCAANSDVGSA